MTKRNDKSGNPLRPNKTTHNTEGNTVALIQERVISFSYPPIKHINRKREVPVIYLHGHWLQEIGFTIGSQYLVERERNKLVITALQKQDEKNNTPT